MMIVKDLELVELYMVLKIHTVTYVVLLVVVLTYMPDLEV